MISLLQKDLNEDTFFIYCRKMLCSPDALKRILELIFQFHCLEQIMILSFFQVQFPASMSIMHIFRCLLMERVEVILGD